MVRVVRDVGVHYTWWKNVCEGVWSRQSDEGVDFVDYALHDTAVILGTLMSIYWEKKTINKHINFSNYLGFILHACTHAHDDMNAPMNHVISLFNTNITVFPW